jgi:trans-2,3-dihydro-3-hydroxyanthranilate isomerase
MAPRDQAAALLGLQEDDLDPDFPPQTVSTGLAFLLIPLRDLKTVKKAAIDRKVEQQLLPSVNARFTFLFSRETYHPQNQVNARMFAETTGVPEDPATGSANGCLAAWMVRHRYLGMDQVQARVEQGYEINRPSLLHLKADSAQIKVGGRVIPIARGEFLA